MVGFGLPSLFKFGVKDTGFPHAFGGAAFSPDDETGLVRWYEADFITGLVDTDPIATWEDASSAAVDATQASSGNRPTYQTNELNGLPIVRFDGNDVFEIGDLSALTEGEVFIVIKLDADPATAGSTSGLWHLGSDTTTTHFPYTDGTIYDGFGTTARKTTVNPTPALTSWRIYNVWSAASDWASNLDGSSLYTTATNTVGFPADARLGANSVGIIYLDGDIAAFILYDHKLSAGTRSDVLGYLQDKYAL